LVRGDEEMRKNETRSKGGNANTNTQTNKKTNKKTNPQTNKKTNPQTMKKTNQKTKEIEVTAHSDVILLLYDLA
jgi:hypothetical protein